MLKSLKKLLPFLIALSIAVAGLAQGTDPDPNEVLPSTLLSKLKYRSVGPTRGGRVTAVAGIPQKPQTFLMGSTGGGVWETTDGGLTWENISDGYFATGSVGAVAVAASDPNVIYVGTGSACPRGNVSPGVGVYKSTDAGKTWKHIGLDKAGQISRIRIHPGDPDLVYVAVLGNVFGSSPDRGIFRSKDGGATWEKVLFINETTGASDLDLNVQNPRILYAGMWRAERKPWTIIDGGPDGGVYKSTDGGDTWEKLEKDLPDGLVGRVGVSISPVNPDRVWVIQEAQEETKGGVFRSDDAGKSFTKTSRDHNLRQRAWYYSHIFADSRDENTVYVLNAAFFRSIDAGKTFERVRTPHGDNHDLWINPENNRIMINGDDGGASVSTNGGETWTTQLNQPTAEFYRVAVDDQFPYRLYGAQQDNTTISVPSQEQDQLTPTESWFDAGGGESGHISLDPKRPNIIYAGNYIGQITRLDREQGHIRDVVAYPQMHDGVAPRDIVFRYQWNAPILVSRHDPGTLYHASQYIHRSRDEGQTWQRISDDLTTDNDAYHDIPGGPIQHDHTGVELYTTVFALEESPFSADELWAGTDDGLLYITQDGGKTWLNITPPDMPKEGTVNSIDVSEHVPGTAYVAVYRYRRNDFHPYVFKTTDFGKSWSILTNGENGIPSDQFVRVVREDPGKRGLLFAGTEYGIYVSFDDGAHWQSMQLNLPITPITDLVLHHQDLVVATQGRSFWILDDITPLHQLTAEMIDSEITLLNPRPAYRTQVRGTEGGRGRSQGIGVTLNFYLKEVPQEPVTLEFLEPDGDSIRTFRSNGNGEDALKIEAGMNQFVWDLAYPKPKLVKGAIMSLARTSGAKAAPGSYGVRLKAGAITREAAFEVRIDPRWNVSASDLQAQFDLATKVGRSLEDVHHSITVIREIRKQAADIASRAKSAGLREDLKGDADALAEKLGKIEEELIQSRNESGQDPINYPPKLDNQFAYLFSIVNGQDAKPTEGSYRRYEDISGEYKVLADQLQKLVDTDLEEFNKKLAQAGAGGVLVPVKEN